MHLKTIIASEEMIILPKADKGVVFIYFWYYQGGM